MVSKTGATQGNIKTEINNRKKIKSQNTGFTNVTDTYISGTGEPYSELMADTLDEKAAKGIYKAKEAEKGSAVRASEDAIDGLAGASLMTSVPIGACLAMGAKAGDKPEMVSVEDKEIEKRMMEKLILAEDSNKSDVSSDMKLIKDSVLPGETLEEATQEFIRILDLLGNDKTGQARVLYTELRKMTDKKKRAKEFEQIKLHYKHEYSLVDAKCNYELVKNSVLPGETLEEATQEFIRILDLLGNDKTGQARVLYTELRKMTDKKKRAKEFEQIKLHYKHEYSLVDAKCNYELVKNSVLPGETLEEATQEFIRILDLLGNDKTGQARVLYTELRKMTDKKKRTEERIQLFKHIKAESNAMEALKNYKIVNQNKLEWETLGFATDEFIEILNQVGNDNTTKAQAKFIKRCEKLKSRRKAIEADFSSAIEKLGDSSADKKGSIIINSEKKIIDISGVKLKINK
ncbi:MAG: hypothetical protein K8T10_14970 [Candidatus Eremiobacteraeota bacterium]|nr:hypothetical protein [Candidatus Eremiobacteraeota bacterium]